ncbi:MAG: hypothetical protein SCH71_13685 [Desulfobulbaceae bacterium]|nr:hypothetical protein [Desulfobulbaceae bacterium]
MLKMRKIITCCLRKTFRPGSGLLPAVILGVVFFLSPGYAQQSEKTGAGIEQKKPSLADQWGIQVESLRSSANGHLLDFRYRVKDPDKATYLVDRRNKPYLIDQASGKVLAVPNTAKVGPMRQTVRSGKPKEDRVYFVLFGNPGGMVKPGSQVTVVIGDFKAEDIVVQ